MNAQLDHVFILCAANAPEAAVLTQLGFKEGSTNTHPGQGTACRRFFFRTSYLELLWVHSAEEAQGEHVRRTGLWDRWSRRHEGACPFGVVLRCANDAAETEPPFLAWSYRPTYLPPGLSIEIASGVPLTEPALFWIAFQRGRALTDEPTAHSLGQTITGVRVGGPLDGPRSDAARVAEALGLLAFDICGEHVLELTLDGGLLGEAADLRPALPMRLRW